MDGGKTRGKIYRQRIIQGVPKKGIDKKLLFGAAQGLNLQFLN